jgi:hypothetical protein
MVEIDGPRTVIRQFGVRRLARIRAIAAILEACGCGVDRISLGCWFDVIERHFTVIITSMEFHTESTMRKRPAAMDGAIDELEKKIPDPILRMSLHKERE